MSKAKITFDIDGLRRAEKKKLFRKLAPFVGRQIHSFCDTHEFTYREFASASKHNYTKICQLVRYGRTPTPINPLTENLLKKIIKAHVLSVWGILTEFKTDLTIKESEFVKELAVYEHEELENAVEKAKSDGRDHIHIIDKYLQSQEWF